MLKSQIIIQKKREFSIVHNRHPWIFSGAVSEVKGEPAAGAPVDILDSTGKWLACAAYSPVSQIRARIWTFQEGETVDEDFFNRRIGAAVDYRRKLGYLAQDGCRLIHGEADGLPALVVDKYGAYLSCQFLSAGTEYHKQEILHALIRQVPEIRGIYERSDNESRTREGLEESNGLLWGEEPPERIVILENGLKMAVHLAQGHKTGYYLDQRENRLAVVPLSKGQDVLDCCCYAGGFGLLAATHEAKSVVFADAAESSLDMVRDNAVLNGIDTTNFEFVKGDVFQLLRKFRDMGRSFDVIILDPPKFASTQARLQKAARGYKDINLLAIKLLRQGGTLLTYSCSAAMTPEFFRTILSQAVSDSGKNARIVRSFSQAPDHPQSLFFPEGMYLTGLQLSVF